VLILGCRSRLHKRATQGFQKPYNKGLQTRLLMNSQTGFMYFMKPTTATVATPGLPSYIRASSQMEHSDWLVLEGYIGAFWCHTRAVFPVAFSRLLTAQKFLNGGHGTILTLQYLNFRGILIATPTQ